MNILLACRKVIIWRNIKTLIQEKIALLNVVLYVDICIFSIDKSQCVMTSTY